MQKLTTGPSQRSVNGVFTHKWDIYVTPLLPKAQGPSKKGEQKDCKGQRLGRIVFSGHDRIAPLTNFPGAVVAWAKATENQASKYSSMKLTGALKSPPLTEEILVMLMVGNTMASRRESVFFKVVVPGRSTKLQWIVTRLWVFRLHKWKSVSYKGNKKRIIKWGEYDQNNIVCMCKLFKN